MAAPPGPAWAPPGSYMGMAARAAARTAVRVTALGVELTNGPTRAIAVRAVPRALPRAVPRALPTVALAYNPLSASSEPQWTGWLGSRARAMARAPTRWHLSRILSRCGEWSVVVAGVRAGRGGVGVSMLLDAPPRGPPGRRAAAGGVAVLAASSLG